MPASREGFIVRVQRSGSSAPAGIGFVVDDMHIVTCAHVVNTALGRGQRAQDKPGPQVRVQVDFPMLGDAEGAPTRSCKVEAWAPPSQSGISGGDVAGLVVVGGEGLPGRAGPARLADAATLRGADAAVFGYPGDPPRQANGTWSGLRLRGAVGGGIIQLDTDSESAIRTQPGYSGSPVVLSDDAGDAVLGMLAVASRDDQERDVYAIPVPELADAWPEVVGQLTIPACPYRGLEPFTVDDAAVFAGRGDEVGKLGAMVGRQALVVVTGPSGVGKSSLVNAGLIPLLRAGGWAAGAFRPGGMPVHALARAVAAAQEPGKPPTMSDVDEWAARIRSDGLASVGSRLALALGQQVLLHADQLEEILDPASCPPELKAEFLEMLLRMPAAPGDGLHVVCTLRADFWEQLLAHPDTGARLEGRWFGLSPMGQDRLEEVVAGPAAARGVHYQDGLVSIIAADAGGGRGLPLLEFALTQLWPHQLGRQITLAAYQGIGGVTGALSGYAEQAYQQLRDQFPEQRIRRVMLALVRSRGGAAEATRRLVSQDRLGPDWEIAQALAKRRLLIIGHDPSTKQDTAEIAHESLIREWPTFASWVDHDPQFQHWLALVEDRAAAGELLPATRVAEAEQWLAERADDVPGEVRQLVQDSSSELRRRVTELENARNRAEQAAREAEARRLAAAAELALATREVSLSIPIALAVESLRLAPVFEADIVARRAIKTVARQISRLDHRGPVTAVAYSPDGTRVATGSEDRSARVFDAATGTEISRLDHGSWVRAVAFSPDSTRVATGSGDRSARVFDAATGTEICRLDHDDYVTAVAFSRDGTRLATGSGNQLPSGGSVRVFDAATGTEVSRLDHDSDVTAAALRPDGTQVATSSNDGSARVIDAATGAQISRMDHDRNATVYRVAFSADGTRVATGSSDGSARVFDAATGAQISRLDHDSGTVGAVAFSPDCTRVATYSNQVGSGGSARVFDAASGAEICRLDNSLKMWSMAFSPDGTRVAIGNDDHSGDRSARVFDAATGAEICRLDLGTGAAVPAVAFSPDGTRIATGSSDGSARVFEPVTGAEIYRLDHGGQVTAVVFSPGGTRVATSSSDHSVRVSDAATGSKITRLDHGGPVYAVAFSPDGTRVATGSGDESGRGSARVSDAATGTEISRLDHGGPVYAVAFRADGTQVATGSTDGSARVFDAATGTEISRLDHRRWVRAVAFSPDGTRIATDGGADASDDSSSGSVRVFDAASGAEISHLSHGSDDTVRAMAFSPDGTRVATGSDDGFGRGSARVFDAASGAEISRLYHGSYVEAVAFSPDGTWVATGSNDGSARVFDAASGAEISRLDHDHWVTAVTFSCDGTRVATGSNDGSARVFDAASGAEISRLDHDSNTPVVAFSPDGTRVATGTIDGSARVWVIDHAQLLEQAMGRLSKNLTLQEWKRFFHNEPYRKTRADLS
jgi:WD40 repeat protein